MTGRDRGRAGKQLTRYIIARDPECQLQYPGICTGQSQERDHIISYRDRPDLDLDPDNNQGACRACNRHKGNTSNPIRTDSERHSRQW